MLVPRKLFLECRIFLVFGLHRVDTLDQSGKHYLAYGICSSYPRSKVWGRPRGSLWRRESSLQSCVSFSASMPRHGGRVMPSRVRTVRWPDHGLVGPARLAWSPCHISRGRHNRVRCNQDPLCSRWPTRRGWASSAAWATRTFRHGKLLVISCISGRGMRTWRTACCSAPPLSPRILPPPASRRSNLRSRALPASITIRGFAPASLRRWMIATPWWRPLRITRARTKAVSRRPDCPTRFGRWSRIHPSGA